MQPPSEDDPTRSDRDQATADHDELVAGRDRAHSDSDQTASDRDQDAADSDQLASDQDQAASDRGLSGTVAREEHDSTHAMRVENTRVRHETAQARYEIAQERDRVADERDLIASERDKSAQQRSREADEHDAEIARLASGMGKGRAVTGAEIILRAAQERRRAGTERVRAAAQRAEAALDRELAARDRRLAAEDRAQAAVERAAATLDSLTGAWLRGPGLVALQGEIDRVRRGSGRLVVAYVDVDGLKLINDTNGHAAGDEILRNTVGVLQAHLRSYELIVRLGGDEFLCAMSEATIADVRGRFDRITSALSGQSGGGGITVGFGELHPDDGPMDVVARADRDLLAVRGRARRVSTSAGQAVNGQK
jgi:diguanylate cyclase (GGDEF)-like protein